MLRNTQRVFAKGIYVSRLGHWPGSYRSSLVARISTSTAVLCRRPRRRSLPADSHHHAHPGTTKLPRRGAGSLSSGNTSWTSAPGARCPASASGETTPVQRSSASCEALNTVKSFESIPGPGGVRMLPYVGLRFMFKPFGKYQFPDDMGDMFASLHDTYGSVVRIRVGKDWVVIVSELSDVETVLTTREPNPFRDPLQMVLKYEQRTGKPFPVLATRNNEEWRRLRSPMNVRLNRPASLDLYIPMQERAAADFGNRLYSLQNSPKAMQKEFFRFAAESVALVCYNRRLGFLDDDANTNSQKKHLMTSLQTAVSCVVEVLFGKRVLCLFIEDSFYKKFRDAMDAVISFSGRCIAEAVDELHKKEREGTLNPNEPNFLLSLLTEQSLTERDILGIIVTLMVAGTDSVAATLQLLLYALAVNPEKQEVLFHEIREVIGPTGSLSAKALSRMPYLKAAVNESLRLHFPNLIGVRRNIPCDLVLGGYHVPKGMTVMLSAPRDQYYHRPQEYLPERWLRDDTGAREHPIHSLAFLPFGFGSRNCIGRRFAEQELYLATVKVLQRYRVSVADNYGKMETSFAPFRTPKRPVPYILQLRT